MSLVVPDFTESVVVGHAAAEMIGQQPITIRLLADSSSTGGTLSTQRVTLGNGAVFTVRIHGTRPFYDPA